MNVRCARRWSMILAGLWLIPALTAQAEERAYRCRIVSYADKWTRRGFGNCIWWRHPNGPLAPKIKEEVVGSEDGSLYAIH